MKITLTLDPVEDGAEAVYDAINGVAMFAAIRDYSERLRQEHKYSETDADVLHAGPGYFRELLYKVLEEHIRVKHPQPVELNPWDAVIANGVKRIGHPAPPRRRPNLCVIARTSETDPWIVAGKFL